MVPHVGLDSGGQLEQIYARRNADCGVLSAHVEAMREIGTWPVCQARRSQLTRS